ncbi:hypothetical protein [Deinococcus navajonensis]|uniref:MORN repeat protein n=1 Tax=Deinococcus navajonensis TaxID=309884 RepID=A0ABV8XSA2_9DEIO
MSRPVLCALMLALLTPVRAAGLPPVPRFGAPGPTAAGGLRPCVMGELRLLIDRNGRVRFLEHGHLYPDNRLRVRQSYDRAGHLSGVWVQWSGFAGPLLNVRGAFDARGRLMRETGYRRAGVTTPLRSYVRLLPARVRCQEGHA